MDALDLVIMYWSYRNDIILIVCVSIIDLFFFSFGTGIAKHQLIVELIANVFVSSIWHHLLNFLMRLLIQVVVISGHVPRTPVAGPSGLIVILGAILSTLNIAKLLIIVVYGVRLLLLWPILRRMLILSHPP